MNTIIRLIKRYWHYGLATVVLLVAVGVVTKISLYISGEKSNYREQTCQISACRVSEEITCSLRYVPYPCYDGMFNYSVTIDNITYTSSESFRMLGYKNSLYLSCIGNGTLECFYDIRDIQNSLSLYAPGFVGLTILCVMMLAVSISGSVPVILLGEIYNRNKEVRHSDEEEYQTIPSEEMK